MEFQADSKINIRGAPAVSGKSTTGNRSFQHVTGGLRLERSTPTRSSSDSDGDVIEDTAVVFERMYALSIGDAADTQSSTSDFERHSGEVDRLAKAIEMANHHAQQDLFRREPSALDAELDTVNQYRHDYGAFQEKLASYLQTKGRASPEMLDPTRPIRVPDGLYENLTMKEFEQLQAQSPSLVENTPLSERLGLG